jgi:hypothetical protein
MQTDLRGNYDFLEDRPLPPTPHFDSASIEDAKPVQPLRKNRLAKEPRLVLRFSTAIFAVLMVVVLGIGAMARLHQYPDLPSTTPSDSEPTVATDSSSDDPEATDSASVMLPKKVNGVRRHRHRYFQPRPEMFEIDDQPLLGGKPRPRLVTVIQN